jgi:hypothetical protein
MSETTIPVRSSTQRFGWGLLLVISALALLNHAALIFVIPGEEVLFIGWTAFNLYSTLVLFFPYRRGERWAWYSTWILPVAFASTALFDAEIGLYYLIAAGLIILGQLLTRDSFFPKK